MTVPFARSPGRYLAGIAAAVTILSISLAMHAPRIGDEVFHYKTAEAFVHGIPVFSNSYDSAYTPLPYMVAGGWLRVWGGGLLQARILNLLIGLIGIAGMYRLARNFDPTTAVIPAAYLAFQPYYLRDCAVFYMGNYGLVASIWALRYYTDPAHRHRAWSTGALLGIATLCSQWALAVVGAIVAGEFVESFDPSWKLSRHTLRARIGLVAIVTACQLPVACVFAGWHGLTHPRFHEHTLAMSMPHVTGVFAVLGFTFALWFIGRARRLTPFVAVLTLASIPVFALSVPEVSVYQGRELFTGLTVRILAGVTSRIGAPPALLIAPAAFGGLLVLVSVWAGRDRPVPPALYLSVVMLLVAYSVSTILGETHVAFALPLIFLLAWSASPRSRGIRYVLAQSCALGVVYAVYFMLLKSS